jgi:lysophospholipase L1-like esterase
MKLDAIDLRDFSYSKGQRHLVAWVRTLINRVAQVLLQLALVGCSILLTLGIGEVYFRVFDPQPIVPRYVEVSDVGIRKNIGHVQGVMSTAEFRHGFTTNSQGFRGQEEFATVKPPGVYRIIVLGDSVTLGHGVEDGETFAAVAQHELGQSRPVEVINMGVSGFGTAEELIQLQQTGPSYQPDLVVLAYFPNDPYNNVVSKLFSVVDGQLVRTAETFVPALYVRDRLYAIPGYGFLCDHSHVVNLVRSRLSAFFLDYLGRANRTSSEISSVLTSEEAQLTGLLLQEVARVADERGVPLVILNIPVILKGQVIENFPASVFQLNQEFPMVVAVAREVYASHSTEELSYREDSHPRPYGHRLIGEELARVVSQRVWANRSGRTLPTPH